MNLSKIQTDSLKALSLVTVSGHIQDRSGNPSDNFNGVVYPIVFDKANKVKTLANDGGTVMEFSIRNNILFSGKTLAKDGKFRFTFIVPRDIDYAYGNGKISYYANNDSEDMNGYFSNVIVGGFTASEIADTSGPEIKLYMNDTLFRNGGITDNNPILLAIIRDKGGINTTGSGIGHDLTGFLDNNTNNSFLLNSYFENDFNNYSSGHISYDLTGLSPGIHTLTIKAWDNYNNSSVESIQFIVEKGDKFVIKNPFNYPNPFLNETRITVEHNRPESELSITVNIFNLTGKTIKILKTRVPSTGYSLPPIIWDGNTDGGKRVGRGVYPYTITIVTETGEISRASGRMIIL